MDRKNLFRAAIGLLSVSSIIAGHSATTGAQERELAGELDPAMDYAAAAPPPPPRHTYLDDADPVRGPAANADTSPRFPRINLTETKAFPSTNAGIKYDVISGKGHIVRAMASIQKAAIATGTGHRVMYLRHFSPRAYQGSEAETCSQAQLPFETSGPVTMGCTMFPGHWLYKVGSATQNAISATETTSRVRVRPLDIKRFSNGSYVVIYKSGTNFQEAEHAKITGVDARTATLTLQRGFKSRKVAHGIGSTIAQHALGAGSGTLNWSYNLSSVSPRDINGRRAIDAMAEYLRNNYNKDQKGVVVPEIEVHGFLFDADPYLIPAQQQDVDNDGVADDGVDPQTKEALWGKGLEEFYEKVRSYHPNRIIVGGFPTTRGFAHLSGVQLEGWPVAGGSLSAITNPVEQYKKVDAFLSNLSFRIHRSAQGPSYTESLSKTPTALYAPDGVALSKDLRPFRFGFGLAMLENGFYGQENSRKDADTWYDEYAVDVATARAIPKGDTAQIMKHKGWMGRPLGGWKRVYDSAAFSPTKSKITGADRDFSGAGIGSWKGSGALVVSKDVEGSSDGAGSLRAQINRRAPAGVSIQIANVSLGTYMVSFMAKASKFRMLRVQAIGGSTQKDVYLDDQWKRYVLSFDIKNSRSGLRFEMSTTGEDEGTVWIDSVHMVQGDANVFRRDFENAVVIVNATKASKSVSLGSETLQRIKGTHAGKSWEVNNGAILSGSVSVPAHDALILVRK